MIEGFKRALREYNAGRFFECHEILEDLLDDTEEGDWNFVLGLIQVAVGYHKLTHGHPGGEHLLEMGLEKLGPYAPDQRGLDLEGLRTGVRADLQRRADARANASVGDAVHPPRLLPVRRG